MAADSDQPLPPPPSAPPPPSYTYPPITIILTIILLIFFFVGFFSIYFCRCFMQNLFITWQLRHAPEGTPPGGANASTTVISGLDPLIVQSFPIFTYSSVKEYRKEKYGLECAICLVEFAGNDVLRLLTLCCHVFHEECIDLWLESHKTCPVCRRNLESRVHSPAKLSPINVGNVPDENQMTENSISITIGNNENEDEQNSNAKKEENVPCEQSAIDKFSRSHSTGHSVIRHRQDKLEEDMNEEKEQQEHKQVREDKYTLRLPKHVKSRIMKGHNSSRSWSTFGEYKAQANTQNVGLGEASGEPIQDVNNIV